MKPTTPKGLRDFGPKEVRRRDYIFSTIKGVFELFGYQPIETPAMETLDTLTGKYGDEGDQLLFKVLNNGDFLAKADEKALRELDSAVLIPSISKRGLRYDLTVPFARYVVMHRQEVALPFKRYQIQPVWRADRPQKGRYQEFYQCDVDVVGSDSLMCEAELVQVYDEVFSRLQLPVTIRLNHRKVLAGIAEVAGVADRFLEMTVAIDKLDKIGEAGVSKELGDRGFSAEAVTQILRLLNADGLSELKAALEGSDSGQAGLADLERVQSYLDETEGQTNRILFDPTLARGLSYYTGCIFEVVLDREQLPEVQMGSLGGGGRYDDLTGVFGMKGIPGVGVSFGAERVYDVLTELDRFGDVDETGLQVLLVAFDETAHHFAFRSLQALRRAGIAAELYPEPAKLKKQLRYADARAVPFALLIGTEEMATGNLSLKNMRTGAQQSLPLPEVIRRLQ